MNADDQLRERLQAEAARRARPQRRGPLGLLITGGTVGLLFVVPLVGGAYLGRWLDEQAAGYSVGWTVNLILLGLAVGAFNVWRFFKEHG